LLHEAWVLGAATAVVAAGALWVAWIFDLPGTRGWYERRISRAFEAWNEQCDSFRDDLDVARRGRLHQIGMMPVPAGHDDDHRALSELAARQEELTGRTDLAPGDRVAEMMGIANAIDTLVTRITDSTADEPGHSYGNRLRALRQAAQQDHQRYHHEVERLGAVLLGRLGRVRPPGQVVEEHAALVAAATHLVDLTDRFTALVPTDDVASARRLAEACERAGRDVHSAARAAWTPDSEDQNAPL
jgi:hypothetical protein